MMRQSDMGAWSLAAAGGTVALAQAFHPAMLASLRSGWTAAWLATLIAGVIAVAIYVPVAATMSTLGKASLIDLARCAGGPATGVVTGVLIAALLVYHTGFVIRETSEMAVSAVYPHTPETFAMATLILCGLYGAYGGTAAIIRLLRLYVPVVTLAILSILAGAASWGEMRYLLPFWGPGPLALTGRSVMLSALFVPQMLFLLLTSGAVRERRRLWWTGGAALLAVTLILALTKVVLLKTFPIPLGWSVTFPLHEMARMIVGGRFFERIEGVWMFAWVFATAGHIAALLHVAAVAYAQATGLPSHKLAVLPLVTLAGTVALFPPDQGRAIMWHWYAAPFALVIGLILPLGLAVVASRRRRSVGGGR